MASLPFSHLDLAPLLFFIDPYALLFLSLTSHFPLFFSTIVSTFLLVCLLPLRSSPPLSSQQQLQ